MRDLILLHGAIGSAAQMLAIEKEAKGWQIHSLNLPGHGGTAIPGSLSIGSFVDFVKRYCNEQQLDKVSFIGYSMGGYVALSYASRFPHRVDRIVTLATKFHWDAAIAEREIKMLQPSVIREKLPRFADALEKRHAPQNWELLLHRTAGLLEALGRGGGLQPGEVSQIGIPVLVMLGDRDKMVSIEETVALYKILPSGRLAILPATPHPIENLPMAAFTALAFAFLNEDSDSEVI